VRAGIADKGFFVQLADLPDFRCTELDEHLRCQAAHRRGLPHETSTDLL
jgi:hypothetical protein